MIIKNGILSTFRDRFRSVLFILLIFILTTTLTLGLGSYLYAKKTLKAMDNNYKSVAVVEYDGENYPDADVADEGARDAYRKMNSLEIPGEIGRWESNEEILAYTDGYKRINGYVPYMDRGVFVVSGFSSWSARGTNAYSVKIEDVLYARGNHGPKLLIDADSIDFEPDPGEKYIINARIIDSISGIEALSVVPFDKSDEMPIARVEGENDRLLKEGPFAEAALQYENGTNYIKMKITSMPEALEEFQQGTLSIKEGYFYGADEKNVCIVDYQLADHMKWKVGDTVKIGLSHSDRENRFQLTKSDEKRELTITGITADIPEWEGNIWAKTDVEDSGHYLYGYKLGQVLMDNESAPEQIGRLRKLCPKGVNVTLYDQGYSAAAEPMRAMKITAIAVSSAALFAALGVLILFSYIFVGRQQETVSILMSLGTPKNKVRLWLMSGALLIIVIAASLGCLTGQLSLGAIIKTTLAFAESIYGRDTRYSDSRIGRIIENNHSDWISSIPAIAAGIIILVIGTILCLFFLSMARSKSTPVRGKIKVRVPKSGTSVRGKGSIRFVFLSIKRGGWRSVAPVVAAMVLSVMLGLMSNISSRWQSDLDALYRNSHLSGEVTSLNGRQFKNLSISSFDICRIWQSGKLDKLSVATGWNFWREEDMPVFSDTVFGIESRDKWINKQPHLMAVNDIKGAPALMNSDNSGILWAEGFDESIFSENYNPVYLAETEDVRYDPYTVNEKPYPCVVESGFLKEKNYKPGDVFDVVIRVYEIEIPVRLQIAGQYSRKSSGDVYVPLGMWISPQYMLSEKAFEDLNNADIYGLPFGEQLKIMMLKSTVFSLCRFDLDSADNLPGLRDYLSEQGYSETTEIGRNRVTILIHDKSFTETAGALERYIFFGKILFPVLYGLVAVLGFIVSYLVINSRRMEIAIMRGMGTGKGKIFMTFFLEQTMLAILGSLAGFAVVLPSGRLMGLEAIGIFLLCYVMGAALSVGILGKTNLMELLTERD